jgi:DNA helicase-2/ATP-dependent DNA helicase PcrA
VEVTNRLVGLYRPDRARLSRYGHAPLSARVVYLDEVQDFDPLELSLVRKWAQHIDQLVLAGDDDQALYAWRGAVPDAFLKPDLAPEHKLILGQSYRIPNAVHRWAMSWVHRISYREPKEYRARDFEGVAEEWPQASYQKPVYLLPLIDRCLAQGKTIAILAACGYLLDPTIRLLRNEGYPFHNPYRPEKYYWNPLGARRGVSGTERLLAFLRMDPRVWTDPRRWTYYELQLWASILESKGLLAHKAKTEIRNAADDSRTAGELVAFEDLDRWIIDPTAADSIAARDLVWFEHHLTKTATKGLTYPLAVARGHGAARLKEQPKITVGTIHSVKGGEADVVVLFPDVSPQGWNAYHAAPGLTRDSVLRQFYVGMTRAKEQFYWTEAGSERAVRGLA